MEHAAREAAASAADASLRLQADDGRWRGFNDAGPMFVGATIACEAALGTLTAEHACLAKQTLLDHQLPDGGLHPWPGASASNAEATLFLIAGLKAVGASDDDMAMAAARHRLDALGGARQAGPLALTIAALVGAVDAALLPRVPAELALLPGHDALVARLLGVNALMPLRTLPFLWERVRAGAIRLGQPTQAARSSAVARRLERYLRDRQNPSGGIAGVPIFTLLGLLCLAACGVGHDDDAVVRGLAYVRRVYHSKLTGLVIEPFESSYWDTAHMVRALARGPDKRHRDAARRGALWLLGGQSTEASPFDWQTPPPGAPDFGGWSWQPGNERNPDFDTTGEVLSALGEVAAVSEKEGALLDASIRRGIEWLLAFQNPDGGWAAFSYGKPRPPKGALYLRRSSPWGRARSWLAENGDPSTADIVGRVLFGLGAARCSIDASHPSVRRAIAFLQAHQLPETGAWWGRWAVNHLAATAYITGGLARVGVDMREYWVDRAVAWMISRQNADGGWGESTDSYEDPSAAGRGPSTVALTGLCASALKTIRKRASRPVRRRAIDEAVEGALQFLLARQRRDGLFRDERCFSTMFPLRAYWLNDTYPTFFALEALL